MSLWSWVNAMSADLEPLEHLPSHGKCTRITAVNHSARDHGRTRAKIRQPVEIDVVENAHTVRCQRLVVERREFLVAPMFCAQAGGNRQNFFASRGRDE